VAVVAESSGYIDEAVDALASDNVFVSSEVADASGLVATIDEQVGDADIGVAVFSDNAALEATGPEIVAELATQTGYETIIVAVGDDLSAGSRVLEAGEAIRIANEAEGATGSLEEALTETVQAVVAASESPSGHAPAGDAGSLVAVGVIAVITLGALAAVVGIAIGFARQRRSRADRGLPESLEKRVAELRTLSVQYAQVAASGNALAADTSRDLAAIAENVTELFGRLDRRSAGDQRSIAAVEYDDKLRKLLIAVDRDYLLDILTHPHLWDDPTERAREVHTVVEAISAELVENIKQVNASRGLHFQVSLDGLIGRRKELQDWEREFDRASGPPEDEPGG
jgi:hypothetical protein